jgi:hypothetical protein
MNVSAVRSTRVCRSDFPARCFASRRSDLGLFLFVLIGNFLFSMLRNPSASPDARQCLAEGRACRGFCRGHLPGPLPGNGLGRRDAAMAELLKMPIEELSRHLQEALSQSNPCLHHAFGAPSSVLLPTGSLPPPMGEECHGPGYM